jgi:hypothetical protein
MQSAQHPPVVSFDFSTGGRQKDRYRGGGGRGGYERSYEPRGYERGGGYGYERGYERGGYGG